MKQLNYKPIGSVLLRLFSVVKRLFRKKLTYKERIDWFVLNFYETGMEYEIIYDSFKNEDLDRIKWYNDFIKIPKYKDELLGDVLLRFKLRLNIEEWGSYKKGDEDTFYIKLLDEQNGLSRFPIDGRWDIVSCEVVKSFTADR